MRVSGKSRRNWSAGPRVLARTESSPTQSGTKQGGPSRDHWAKLGRHQYTRSQYSPVRAAIFERSGRLSTRARLRGRPGGEPQFDGGDEIIEFERSVMKLPVDEECRRPVHTAAHAAQKIGLHLRCILPGRQRASQIGLGQTKRVGQSE